ncbi:MAG TPA: [protein-PII] uridylyltransferase [Chromatiales bacterium]|nr:[protein-PII] uridylyltransferase [Chromatiales bacterium]
MRGAPTARRDPLPSPLPGLEEALARGLPEAEAARTALAAMDEALRAAFEAGTPAPELVHGRARQMDELLRALWRRRLGADAGRLALVAVGGYGRGELMPRSDVDLMILVPEGDGGVGWRAAVEGFWTLLWDLRLDVGHSVRTVAQCVEEAARDVTVATNLMEARLLAGDAALYRAMREATGPRHLWPSEAFFAAKRREQEARHHRFHDTAYKLEPNIKEGPGGLRDIQMIGWVAKRHYGAEHLHELVAHGFLTEREHRELTEGQALLWRIRIGLHLLTGRREDRLLFDHQPELARRFGYRDDDANLAVEQFMKRYYRTVQTLSRLNEMLLQHFEEEILHHGEPGAATPLGRRFQVRHGFIEVRDAGVFRRHPFALLEIFLLLAQHPELAGVRASTIRLVREHLHLIDERFRADLRARSLFMELLRQPRGITHELRRMHRYGVLGAYLPAFGEVEGQMQYDLFHAYTVDEHTLFVVRNLRRMALAEHAAELPLCSEVFQRLPKPELLYLAGLFHDLGKGRGGDHSVLGARMAEDFCRAHGFGDYDSGLVSWLVRHHLAMSLTAQREDLGDPEVVNRFARLVGDQVRLDYLYLLTVADIRGTNPNLWNSWRDALLAELYHLTRRALRRGLEQPVDKEERIREVRTEARRLLRADGVDPAEVERVWRDFDEDYFLRYQPAEIAWHTAAIARAERLPLVLVRRAGPRGTTEIFVYGAGEDHAFAATTALLDQMGLTIVDARIISSRSGRTLDTYLVLEREGTPIADDWRAEEIRSALERLLAAGAPVPRVTRRPPRTHRHFRIPTEVSFSEDERNRRTVVELITADRPGLLSRVARAFAECGVRLQNARIATVGARAEDVFFVTDARGEPLRDRSRLERLRERLVASLDADAQASSGG